MSQFDESKLSRILARRIIAPEDRSQFLPLCTPIYCPDNNGVKASQVTIIDPNLNTFFEDVDPTNTRSKYIGSQLDSTSGVRYPSGVTIPEALTVDPETGLISNFKVASTAIQTNMRSGTISSVFSNVKKNSGLIGSSQSGLYVNYDSRLCYRNQETGSVTDLGVAISESDIFSIKFTTNGTSVQVYYNETQVLNLDNGGVYNNPIVIGLYAKSNYYLDGSINGYETFINGVPLIEKITEPQIAKQPNEVQNIINIDLNKSVSRDYFVPYEVELKSDADIMSVIKSDFAAYFKNRVSNEIYEQLVLLHTTDTIPTINMGATLAEAFGEVLTSFISQGTGQKFSIYKYNNGAPVVYSEDSSQPNIDKDINQTTDMTFVTKDDINVPALYYVEQPTLILPNTTYVDYQTELCNGNIKEYARKMINVETATADFSQLGKGVFGTNDTFAVAFSSPSIKLVPDTNFYGYRLCCTMLYGVKLVHKHNLRLFI